ncbi:MAG: hypothetical protein ACLQVD_06055 [Capsulimonadaceae bacterium]
MNNVNTDNRDLDPTLRRVFGAMVDQVFLQKLGVYDPSVTGYIADVLTDFAHMRQVYKVKDLEGRPLEEVADMLLQADVRLLATSFNREREVHRHIGDFTMFWAGVYPEALPHMRSRWRKDQLVDYMRQGKSSYAIAASFDYGAYRLEAPVLKRLSDEFELCVYGLNAVRGEMDRMARA